MAFLLVGFLLSVGPAPGRLVPWGWLVERWWRRRQEGGKEGRVYFVEVYVAGVAFVFGFFDVFTDVFPREEGLEAGDFAFVMSNEENEVGY